MTDDASEAVELAERLVGSLPDCPAWDYRFNNKCQLQYFVAKARYSLCTSQDEARRRLFEIGAIIERSRNCASDDESWLYRRAWAVQELIDLSAPRNWIESLSNFEDGEFQGPLGDLVLRRAEHLMFSAEDAPEETVASALVTAARSYWLHCRNRSGQDPITKQTDVAAIVCGLVGGPETENDAAQCCIDLLSRPMNPRDQGASRGKPRPTQPQIQRQRVSIFSPRDGGVEYADRVPHYSREDLSRLLQIAFVWSSARQGSQAQALRKLLEPIGKEAVGSLAKEIPWESRWRLWSLYLRFQIRLLRQKDNDTSDSGLRLGDLVVQRDAIKRKEKFLNTLYDNLASSYPDRTPSILEQQFGFAAEVWQRHLRWLRLEPRERVNDPCPDLQEAVKRRELAGLRADFLATGTQLQGLRAETALAPIRFT